jgi:hypothetical protein
VAIAVVVPAHLTYQPAGRRKLISCPAVTEELGRIVFAGVDVGPIATVVAVPDVVTARYTM